MKFVYSSINKIKTKTYDITGSKSNIREVQPIQNYN